jgi:hypothetical protein
VSLFNFENRYVTKNGAIVWLLWTSLPIDSDKVVYAIAKNITYKKELEEERNIHLANLQNQPRIQAAHLFNCSRYQISC